MFQHFFGFVALCALTVLTCLLAGIIWAPVQEWDASSEGFLERDDIRHGPAVSELLERFWQSAAAVRGEEASSDVLGAIVRKIQETATSFVGETALAHAALLCAEAEHEDAQTLLVYAADRDLGQVSYMLGTRLPYATVLTLHPSAWESWRHAAFLDQMRLPGGLMLHEVVSAGVWGAATDLRRLASTPAVVDVQVAIGTRFGQPILEPAQLRNLLAIARWTLISLPLEALEDKAGDPISQALALRGEGDIVRLSAEVGVLGLVRVPATQEMQALFLVWSWHVERRVHTTWHRQAAMKEQLTVRYGIDRNATIESREGFAEAAGLLLETLVGLGLPLSERVSLMAAALSDIRPGPANWVVCCGGIWQWSSGADSYDLLVGATGVVSYLSCAFGLAPRAFELYSRVCKECEDCDQKPLEANTTAEICVQCAECLAQVVAPKLLASGAARQLPRVDVKLGGFQQGFVGPFADDVPGLGDLGNVQVLNAGECASLCRENPRCLSFEFSATVGSLLEQIRNCQLASARTRGGSQYSDFVLYLKDAVPGHVDEGLVILFDAALNEEEPEALFDTGRAFGVQGNGAETARFGWLCSTDGVKGTDPSSSSGSSSMPLQDALRCPGGAAWQIGVPAGLYEVQLILQGPPGKQLACFAEGEPLRLILEGSRPPPPSVLGMTEGQGPPSAAATPDTDMRKANADAAAAQMEALFAASLGPPTYIGRADRVPVSSSGLLRLTGCSHLDQQLRLKRVELRRTWQDCPLPKAASDAHQKHKQALEAWTASDAHGANGFSRM